LKALIEEKRIASSMRAFVCIMAHRLHFVVKMINICDKIYKIIISLDFMKFSTLQAQKYLSISLSDIQFNNLSLFLPNIDSLILSQIINNFVIKIKEKYF
jgi:hypothetical protein